MNDIEHLLKLATVANEFDIVDFKLADCWDSLRERHGLAKLILLIQEHVNQQSQSNLQTHKTIQPGPNQDAMQRM